MLTVQEKQELKPNLLIKPLADAYTTNKDIKKVIIQLAPQLHAYLLKNELPGFPSILKEAQAFHKDIVNDVITESFVDLPHAKPYIASIVDPAVFTELCLTSHSKNFVALKQELGISSTSRVLTSYVLLRAIQNILDYEKVDAALQETIPCSTLCAKIAKCKMKKEQAEELLRRLKADKNPESVAIVERYNFLDENLKKIEEPAPAAHVMLPLALYIDQMARRAERVQGVVKPLLLRPAQTNLRRRIQVDLKARKITLVAKTSRSLVKKEGSWKRMRLCITTQLDRTAQPTFEKEAYVKTKKLSDPDDVATVRRELDYAQKYRDKRGIANVRSFADISYISQRTDSMYNQIAFSCKLADGDLSDVQSGKITLDTTSQINVCKDILHGIKALHDEGDMHNDLKPENILITIPVSSKQEGSSQKATAAITDFGLTVPVITGERVVDPITYYNKGIYGSTCWTAPEVLRGGDGRGAPFTGDHSKAEMFAIGALLYQVIFKKIPPWADLLEKFVKDGFPQNARARFADEMTAMIENVRQDLEKYADQMINTVFGRKEGEQLKEEDLIKYVAYILLNPNPTFRQSSRGILNAIELYEQTRAKTAR